MPEIAYKKERYPETGHVNRGIFDAHMERIDQRADHLEQQMNERFDRVQNAIKEGDAGVKQYVEATMERKFVKHEASLGKAINELNMNVAKISGQLEGTNARLEALEGKVAQAVTMLGIIVAVFGVIITVVIAAIQYMK